MTTDLETTKVIFRMWPNGDCIAFFPDLPGDIDPFTCMSYEHSGQHGAASVSIPNLRPAIPQEYAGLKQELEGRGYRLEVVKRFTSKNLANRRAALARMY